MEQTLIVAHRGASRDAPENTICAFQLAWEQGADAIEADFRLTKDGHIVCIHDDNTKRVSDRTISVRNSTLLELRSLDAGHHRGNAFKGAVIPTIEEVFSTIPASKSIYIEIKCGAEIIRVLLDKIRHSGLTNEQIVMICFDKQVLKDLKALAPQYKTSWLCSFKTDVRGETTPSVDTVMETMQLIQADGISSNTAIPESFIKAIEKKGYEWHVWTVDDAITAEHMQALGVRSITTNVPGILIDTRNRS